MKLTCKRYVLRALTVLIVVLVYIGCKREGPAPEVKPLLKTDQAVVNTASEGGITITGEFILSGRYRSIQYGFHLSTNSSFIDPIIIPAGADNEPDRFNATVNIGLKPDVKYYVRAWAKTEKYEVFGNTIEFVSNGSSAPVIDKVLPSKGILRDTIMILGKNFDFSGKENNVFFNDVAAAKIWSKRDTIWAIVPVIKLDQDLNMTINVEVFSKRTLIGQPFTLATPVVSGISISQGQYPDTVKVIGDNFFTDYTTLLVDGVATSMFDVTKKTFSFVVPYLKQDRVVKIELNSFKRVYSITENFHYLGQSILNCSPGTAWIGDTIKLYAKNLDFRRIQLNIKNLNPMIIYGSESIIVTRKWKDSLNFILSGKYQASEFNLDIQFGEKSLGWPPVTFKTVDQKILIHRSPILKSLEKNELVYAQNNKLEGKGTYILAGSQGVLVTSLDGTISVSFQVTDNVPSDNRIIPGDYKVQLYSYDRLSNPLFFKVKVPSISNVSPSFSRYDTLQIEGKNLPYSSNYKFTHTESGRSFDLRNWWEHNDNEILKKAQGEDVIGRGNYQLELSIGDQSYKYPGIVIVKDYFSYVKKLTGSFWQISSVGCGFAINSKLYIPQQSGEMSIVDLETSNVRKKQGYYNYDHQPVFFGNKILMKVAIGGKYVIGSFNEVTEDWDALNMTGVAADFSLYGFGVFNDQLIAISQNGDIYQYNQKWTFLSNIKLNFYFIHYIYFANGNLYLCDFYMGKIAVVSTTNWKIIKEISMPGLYENSLRYIFEIQGQMFFCAKPRGGGDDYYELYKFTSNETFEALSPRKLKSDYHHFCPDGKGNVYYINQGYVYKFNP